MDSDIVHSQYTQSICLLPELICSPQKDSLVLFVIGGVTPESTPTALSVHGFYKHIYTYVGNPNIRSKYVFPRSDCKYVYLVHYLLHAFHYCRCKAVSFVKYVIASLKKYCNIIFESVTK